MDYRIYYSDGSTADYNDFDQVKDVLDVQIILQKDEEGRWHTRAGGDYYIRRDGEWVEVDLFGLFDYLMETGLVLFGRTVSNTKFTEALKAALVDMEKLG